MSGDRGTDTTRELAEIRTLLTRAENAREKIGTLPETWVAKYGDGTADPDRDEMIKVLDQVIALLVRWRRTGRGLR